MDKPVTLREALSEYSKWVAAVYAACAYNRILPVDALEYLDALRLEMRQWLGEKLLDTPIGDHNE